MAVDFLGAPLTGVTPLTVNFTDLSDPVPGAWDWDYGDGTLHGVTQNPVHIYVTPATYNVALTATSTNYFAALDVYRPYATLDGIIWLPTYDGGGATQPLAKALWNTQQQRVWNNKPFGWQWYGGTGGFCEDGGNTNYLFMHAADAGWTEYLYWVKKDGSSASPLCLMPSSGWAVNLAFDVASDRVIQGGRFASANALEQYNRSGTLTDTWTPYAAVPFGLCTFADGKIVIMWQASGRIRIYSGWKGAMLQETTGMPATGSYCWLTADDSTGKVYKSGLGSQICEWNWATGAITTYVPPIAQRGVTAYGGWVYFKPGGASMYRYNFGTTTLETWTGAMVPVTTTKLAYITANAPGPTMDQVMRGCKWFNGGSFQGMYLGWR